ncbi:MAG: NAD(P)-dependent oxidoreductase [Patescibacteria group bacterium]
MEKTIAVIGTGIMGTGIAMNFLKNGYKVIVWNRNKDKVKDLTKKGASSAISPKEATEKADVIFEVTANDESSKSMWLGKEGILEGATSDKVLITDATLSVPWIDELIQICKKKKLTFFDMPMTGGRIGAETGKLVLLVGGEEKKLKSLLDLLSAISEKVVYFGKEGSGMRYKLLLNMLQAIHVVALGEVLNLGKELGLDIDKVGNALAERPGGVSTGIAWRDYHKEPNPINFSVEWITKDITYAKQSAKKTKTPLLDETLSKYKKAIAKKMNNKDWTTVNKLK